MVGPKSPRREPIENEHLFRADTDFLDAVA
jgi:hypothetical protein